MAIVNQMNSQRVVVGTPIKYEIKRLYSDIIVIKSALVNGTNGWRMYIKHQISSYRRMVESYKRGPVVFFSCPRAAAVAVLATLRATYRVQNFEDKFYVYCGDFAVLEFDLELQNAARLEAILRSPPVHPVIGCESSESESEPEPEPYNLVLPYNPGP